MITLNRDAGHYATSVSCHSEAARHFAIAAQDPAAAPAVRQLAALGAALAVLSDASSNGVTSAMEALKQESLFSDVDAQLPHHLRSRPLPSFLSESYSFYGNVCSVRILCLWGRQCHTNGSERPLLCPIASCRHLQI